MPRRIPRDEAVRRIALLHRESQGCLLCAVIDGRVPAARRLVTTTHADAVLTRFPREWGHVLVVARRHVTSFADTTSDEWSAVSELARQAAIAVERVLRPARCYVASLGTTNDDVVTSYPHLHLHVLPVLRADDRPSAMFSWEPGVLEAEEPEWDGLARALADGWPT
ncbi:MAG: HIT family protein [Deltaproteobacteria bacterium]|nr:HIT family protein [Deltaproteobacteria bacterium]